MSTGPIAELISGLERALTRREAIDWAGRDRATSAFEVARTDYSALTSDPIAGPMALLQSRFDLDDLDLRILAVAVGAELDPTLHLLCGMLSGDEGAGRPTVALALELAGAPFLSPAARARLGGLAPLRRHRLLTFEGDGALLSRRLRVPDRVMSALFGDDLPDPALLPLLVSPVPVAVAGTDVLVGALEAGHQLVWVHAPIGTAGTSMAAAACLQLNVPCVLADLNRRPSATSTTDGSQVPYGPSLTDLVQALILEAGLTGSVLILAGAERAAGLLPVLEQAPVPVVAVGSDPWDPMWSTTLPISVAAPRVSLSDRAEVWWPLLGGNYPDREITALRLTPEDISLVGQHAREMAAVSGSATISSELIRQAARRLGRSRNSRASAATTSATIDDLVLPEHTRHEVERLLDWARHRDEVLAQGPLQGKGGKGSGICALFSGSPGTGKTLTAHIIADTLGMDLFTVELSSIVDKYIGETEKNLEKVFSEAESLNAVLFFDEADALFGSRSEVKDAKDRYANQEVAYLLQRMEQFDGITVLATNLRGNLDPAFSRRLHFMIHFPDPDPATRKELWRHHLGNLAGTDPMDPVDIEVLSESVELAGGEIRNIILSSAYAAVAEGCLVGMRHVLDSTIREYTKLGRRVPSREFFSSAVRR
ncbi:AAA family ATPase [Nakamurella silvestris]|nr:AAA family ATPase [Nakamurella silvestris]